jgi:hypothetical protein
MQFNEDRFRVSVETGGIDKVSTLGLPSVLNVMGAMLAMDGSVAELPAKKHDYKIKDLLHYMYIQSPAGPAEARSALIRYLRKNKTLRKSRVARFVQLVPEDDLSVIGRCIAVYHEVLDSVRKPFKSKWYRKEVHENNKVKYTWVNVAPGVEPKPPAYVLGGIVWQQKRVSVGLSVCVLPCVSEMVYWKTYEQQLKSLYRTVDRFSAKTPLFEELIRVACHPRRYLRNCVDERDTDMYL